MFCFICFGCQYPTENVVPTTTQSKITWQNIMQTIHDSRSFFSQHMNVSTHACYVGLSHTIQFQSPIKCAALKLMTRELLPFCSSSSQQYPANPDAADLKKIHLPFIIALLSLSLNLFMCVPKPDRWRRRARGKRATSTLCVCCLKWKGL